VTEGPAHSHPSPPTGEGRTGIRAAGILLHPTSLPGRFGIGDFGPVAERFLDWTASAGQTIWQILPLGPTGFGASPYGVVSAFAGNPMLLSPERLVEDGLLSAAALDGVPDFREDTVEWDRVREWKEPILRAAWTRSAADARVRAELDDFREAPEQRPWLADWTLFAALCSRLPRGEWPREIERRDPGALASARKELASDIAYQEFLQLQFFRQWQRIRVEAHRRGISIFGDFPIYVSPDSADVWAHSELFALDAEGRALEVAGVPPDFFSSTGQLWGCPLYRWERIEADGFAWWIDRFRAAFRQTDIVRLDHFRGLVAYWAVPAGETTAVNGRWRPGPGRKLFDAVRDALGDVALVAEDLGTITPDVRRLLAELDIPGMKVLQFAFFEPNSPYLPHRHVPNAVVYTGTHDNDTARGWWESLEPATRQRVRDYLGCDGPEIEWDLIREAYKSVADRAIIPLQDVFGLGSEARMNTPAEPAGNWSWRARSEAFRGDRAARLARLAELTGRRGSPVQK
jgi:4-alpha-glucanotransferase